MISTQLNSLGPRGLLIQGWHCRNNQRSWGALELWMATTLQWIGWKQNLQKPSLCHELSIILNKYIYIYIDLFIYLNMGLSCKFSLKPIHWTWHIYTDPVHPNGFFLNVAPSAARCALGSRPVRPCWSTTWSSSSGWCKWPRRKPSSRLRR